MKSMFRVKICGITTPEDARLAVEAGADAIGINFYAASPRYVQSQQAVAIAQAVGPRANKVGVFVDTPAAEICRVADQVGLDTIQLHGDQKPDFLATLVDRPVIQAYRVGSAGVAAVAEHLTACAQLGCPPQAALIDAFDRHAYGGTGKLANWASISLPRPWLSGIPLVLAGGLTAENVAEAIETVRPDAVDVASGVEASPGQKDPDQVARFVHSALKSLDDGM